MAITIANFIGKQAVFLVVHLHILSVKPNSVWMGGGQKAVIILVE